ncbi:uncharacterized protein Tco025E_00378 [Trypanosoma conorhini]|uniref:Uncharacterized protein n=1 Tax=Trypanosoma conorhini TaxID=83891 RepID=A0A3R7LFI1_9TRYP|nr:uncharacterized protein Tco025E_00378 [Trypanosoma conorhini]RNF27379.1 hypothetical protein Tco025E_00378 [Trypanosoma conorhini]
MTWIVIDRSSKGSLSSFPQSMQRAVRPAGPALRPKLRTGRAAGIEERRSHRGVRRVSRGTGQADGSGRSVSTGRGRRRRDRSESGKSAPEKEEATSEPSAAVLQNDEQAHRFLDNAWGKFGEARVLVRQNCFLAAWRELMEAKDFIDAAAGNCSCGLDRHNQALVQLGHELSAATQSWLRWESLVEGPGLSDPPRVGGAAATDPLQSQRQAERQQERESQRSPRERGEKKTSNDEAEDAGEGPKGREGLNEHALPRAPQSAVETKLTMDIKGSGTNIFLQGGHWDGEDVLLDCSFRPAATLRWRAPGPAQGMWSSPADQIFPQGQCFPYAREAGGKPGKRFSDGILLGKSGQAERTASRSSSAAPLSLTAASAEEAEGQAQPKQQAAVKEGGEPAAPSGSVEGQTQATPGHPPHGEGATQRLKGAERQNGVTADVSSREKPAPAGTDAALPPEEAPRQPTEQRRCEGVAEDARRGERRGEGLKNDEAQCLSSPAPAVPPPSAKGSPAADAADAHAAPTKSLSPFRSIPDLGEPQLVRLYAFELEKPRPTSEDGLRPRTRIARRPLSATAPARSSAPKPPTAQARKKSPSYGKLMPSATSLSPAEGPVLVGSSKIATETRHPTESHLRTGGSGGGGRRPLPYLSVYHAWQGGGSGQVGSVLQSRSAAVPEEATTQSSPCQQGGPQATATSSPNPSQPSGVEVYEASGKGVAEAGDGGPHRDGHRAEKEEEHRDKPVRKRQKLVSTAASLRGCFDGVKSYHEARELHQQMVQKFLRREEEEEAENEDEADGEERVAAQAPQECAAHMLGHLEEAYYDWLVEHLCIKRRHVQLEEGDALTPTGVVTGAEATGAESGEGTAQGQTDSSAAACPTTTVSLPLRAPVLTERLEAALKFGRVDTPPTATPETEESGGGGRAEGAAAAAQPPSPGKANGVGATAEDGGLAAPVAAAQAPSVTPVAVAAGGAACGRLRETGEGREAAEQEEAWAPQLPHADPQAEPFRTNANNVIPDTNTPRPRRVGCTLVFLRERR